MTNRPPPLQYRSAASDRRLAAGGRIVRGVLCTIGGLVALVPLAFVVAVWAGLDRPSEAGGGIVLCALVPAVPGAVCLVIGLTSLKVAFTRRPR